MKNWVSQIFIAVIVVSGLAGFMMFLAMRDGPREYSTVITNTGSTAFAMQKLMVRNIETGEEVRDLYKGCERVDAHYPQIDRALVLSPGQSKEFVWDGLVAGCTTATRISYELVAVDLGENNDFMNPEILSAKLAPR